MAQGRRHLRCRVQDGRGRDAGDLNPEDGGAHGIANRVSMNANGDAMSPLARMFGAMISGFATGGAIAAVIVFALMMWMSRPKAPERATVEPPSAPAQEPAPSWKPSEPAEPRAIRQQ